LTARHDELGTSKVGLEKKERKSKDQIKAKIAKFRENRSGPARPVYAGDYAAIEETGLARRFWLGARGRMGRPA